MKSFIQFLNEMPLPKGVDPDALAPKSGPYNSKSSIGNAKNIGKHVGGGSSREAYLIKIEPDQIDNPHDHEIINGFINTVVKIAFNNDGLLQNEEEIKIYRKFKDNPLLLPIIDTSVQNRQKFNIETKTGRKQSVSNWIQMPLAKTFTNQTDYAKEIKKFFRFNPTVFDNSQQIKNIIDKHDDQINEIQKQNLINLSKLLDGGYKIDDFNRTNVGIYKDRIVLLDYGFTTKTSSVYNGSKEVYGDVDENGNITIEVK